MILYGQKVTTLIDSELGSGIHETGFSLMRSLFHYTVARWWQWNSANFAKCLQDSIVKIYLDSNCTVLKLKSIYHMNTEKVKGSNTGRIISIVVGAALLGAVIFLGVMYYQEKSKNDEIEADKTSLTSEIESLEEEIEDFQLDMENQDLAIEDKERILAEKENAIEKQQKRINELLRQNKISKERAEMLVGKVEQLEYYVRRYQDEIEDLKEQVAVLTDERNDLSVKVNNMSGAVSELTRENEKKDFVIEVAKILNATNFSSYYIRSSGKRVPENPIRRGRMQHFEICLDIFKNPASEMGQKEIYMQIKNPNGEVVKHNAWGSGYVNIDGRDEAYTGKKSIEYDRTTQKVCMDFEQPENYEFEKGDYSVRIYCEGYDIGNSSFSVK